MAEANNTAVRAPLYDGAGSPVGEIDLDPEMFGVEPNRTVMHQVVVAHLAAQRSGTAKVKSRSEVRGGGRKPWRQKGLGRARHGSIRSPLWVGGGSAHGPAPRSFAQHTPRKMRTLALRSALSSRAAEGEVKVVERFGWETPKTKRAQDLLTLIGVSGRALVVLDSGEETVALSFSNLPQVVLCRTGNMNAYDVLWSDTVLFSGAALGMSGVATADVAEQQLEPDQDEAAADVVDKVADEEQPDSPPPDLDNQQESDIQDAVVADEEADADAEESSERVAEATQDTAADQTDLGDENPDDKSKGAANE